ncbi:MAG: HYR domain-containing protein [Cyclobacteriaceae bacterium]
MNKKAFIFCLLFSVGTIVSFGQSCNCPAVCAPCIGGGLTRIELKFNQPVDQHIEANAFDIGGVNLFNVLQFPPLGTVVLIGSKQNDRFVGDKVTIKVNGLVDVVINTRCSDNVLVGDTYGSFTVVAAESKNGGPVCCNAFVTQNIRPTITNCPANVEQQVFDQTCFGAVSWMPPIAADNCQIVSFTEQNNYKPGDIFPLGRRQIVYTAVDNNGLSRDCIFEVRRLDMAPPVFDSFPLDIIAFATTSCNAVVTWAAPVASDCGGVFLTAPPQSSGDRFPIGVTAVTYAATDGSSNRAERSFNVTVVDNAKPTFNIDPTDIAVQAVDCGAIVSWIEPTADDNCPIGLTVTQDHFPNEKFAIGITTVTYIAKDASGNTFPYSFKITVEDKTAPVISPMPSTEQLLTTACDVVVNWVEPLVTDNCKFKVTSNFHSGDRFGLGTFKVIYTAKDSSQNTSTSFFDVVIKDNTAPIFTSCITSTLEKEADPITCKAKVNWTAPTATDNCLDRVLMPAFKPGDEFPIGTTVITYIAKDKAGNTSQCEFPIIVNDKTGPTITAQPSDIATNANTLCKANVNWVPPTAIDNCSSPVTLGSNYNPNDAFPLGATKVTYTVQDKMGNASTAFFNVTVNDNTAPVFSGCPLDIIISSNASCKAIVNWTEPTAFDNCNGTIIPTSNFKSGTTFDSGTTTAVTYTAVDNAGNKSTCKFNVIVRNESVPVISGCPQDIIIKTDETGKAIVTWTEPTATDQCGRVPLIASRKPSSEFGIGTTKITYESTPNSASIRTRCEFNVILSYKEIEFEVGKAITPNGDPVNENWLIRGLENFRDNSVLIVDRWGNKIYEASQYDNSKVVWNGTNSSGTVVPTGTYFYSVAVSFQGKRVEKKGSVEVVR